MALKLMAHVGLDGSGFEAGLNRIEHAGKHAFSELKMFALEAFGVYGAGQMFRKSIEDAKELVTAAQRLGTDGVEGWQLLREAAMESKTELETVEKVFDRISIARAKALAGDQKAKDAFKDLKIDPHTSTQEMVTGRLHDLALKMNPQDFGPMGRDIVRGGFGPVIAFLKTDFEELGEHMKKMGTLVSTETAVKLKMMGDELELVSRIILVQLGPAIISLVESLLDIVGRIKAKASELGGRSGSDAAAKYGGAIHLTERMLQFQGVLDAEEANPGSQAKWAVAEAKKIAEDYAKMIKDGTEAASPVIEQWAKQLAELKAKLKDEADKLKNPVPPKFTDETPAEKEKRSGNRIDSADALVRVGNFLGDNQGALASIAKNQLTVLHSIEKNTRGGGRHGNFASADGNGDDIGFPTA